MKVVIQRCKRASVTVNNKLINKINKGMMILVGFTHDDTIDDINYIVRKIINLRIFDDEKGIMNKSILNTDGNILSISQFTLYGSTKDGNRPSYANAMKSEEAIKMYEIFNNKLNESVKTYPGIFGAEMEIELINDGPVTIIIDSKNK